VAEGVYAHIGDLGARTAANEGLNANIGLVLTPAGAVLIGRSQRVRESVLLRTLGATKAQVNRIMFAEYLALGTLGAAAIPLSERFLVDRSGLSMPV